MPVKQWEDNRQDLKGGEKVKKKIIRLINNERSDIKIRSGVACDQTSADICPRPSYDYMHCSVYSYDYCGNKDYDACHNYGYDYCSYNDRDDCTHSYDYN